MQSWFWRVQVLIFFIVSIVSEHYQRARPCWLHCGWRWCAVRSSTSRSYTIVGYNPLTIACHLQEKSLPTGRWGVDKFLKKYNETGSMVRCPGSGRPSMVMWEVKCLVEQRMRLHDEMTAYQLHAFLKTHGISIFLCSVLCCSTCLGWTFWGSAYSQVDSPCNKRLTWACENIDLQ